MRIAAWVLVLMPVFALAACGGEKEFETLSEINQERAAAGDYSKGKLEKLAKNASEKRYEYMQKQREIEAKIRDIPLEKQFEGRAVKLKEELRVYADKVRDYGMLYDSYMENYLRKGGDYEKIKLRRE